MTNFLMIIIEQSLLYVPLLYGAYISFSLLKVPDLSLESAYLMGALSGATALAYSNEYTLFISLCSTMLASCIGGVLVGLCSSIITLYGKIPHLLSAIITFGLFHGIFQLCSYSYQSLAGYKNVLMIYPIITLHPEITILAIISGMIVLICSYILAQQLGYSFVIFGQNPYFFNYFNICKSYVFMSGIMIANGLAGISGFLCAQSYNLIELNMGIGKSLFCITVLILGKAIMRSSQYAVYIPVCGLLLYFALQQSLLKIGFNLKFFTMIQSIVVLLVLVYVYKNKSHQYDQLGV